MRKSSSSKTITQKNAASSSTPQKSAAELTSPLARQRSVSLPSLEDDERPLFPSPSSSFHPPPANETEILHNLLARDRAKRDASSSTSRRWFRSQKKRSTSVGGMADSTALSKRRSFKEDEAQGIIPSMNSAESVNAESEDSPIPQNQRRQVSTASSRSTATDATATGYDTPTTELGSPISEPQLTPTALKQSAERKLEQTPSRPTSSYMPYLPELDSSSAEVARRLSLSTSRRHSRLSVSSNSSSSGLLPTRASAVDLPTVEHTPTEEFALSQQTASIFEIKIKDYAFPSADPRHIGQIVDASAMPASADRATSDRENSQPRASLRWNPRIGSLSENPFDDSSSDGGLSSSGRRFSNNSGGNQSPFTWDFMPPHQSSQSSLSQSQGSTLRHDTGSPNTATFAEGSEHGSSSSAPFAGTGQDIPSGGALYIAAYEFIPEASQEMSLHEGEIVRVLERICEGWVVASRTRQTPLYDGVQGEEETGLVPDAYLRPIMNEEAETKGQELNDHTTFMKAMSRLDVQGTTSPPMSPN